MSEIEYDGPVRCIMHGVYDRYITALRHALRLRVEGAWWLTVTELTLDREPVNGERAPRRHITDEDINEVFQIDPSLKAHHKNTFRNIWVIS